ncbi:GntR family transcriptional regulator [Microbacterium sp.]|uniref:GntR family transcriptional regulator n=1 Tax=Microbacterium sp. TaxID=51671 RepID=UPI003C76D634
MADSDPIWPDELFLDLDRSGPVPLYYQVSNRLESAIRTGAIPAGARLENEIAIGKRLGISRPTVRRAIQEVVDKGLLVRRRGIGTQVVQSQVTRRVELTSLFEDLQTAEHHPTTRVLVCEVVSASTEVATGLGMAVGDDVFYLRRLRNTDGHPVAVLENYLPMEFSDITVDDLIDRGLYDIMRSRGVSIRVANQKIGARRAQADESTLLEIEKSAPVLTMERIAFDSSGKAVEYGHHCYRPDRYSFETTLVA